MLSVGQQLPSFSLKAVPGGALPCNPNDAFIDATDKSFPGKWLVLFAWPKDFTFVCPTEIAAFGRLTEEFADRYAQLLGLSIDSEFVHLAWKPDHEALPDRPIPSLSDVKRRLCTPRGHPAAQ